MMVLNPFLQIFGLVMTRCYDKYGCYSLGGNFYSIYRPINVFPMSPNDINVTFHLFNRRLHRSQQLLDYRDNSSLIDSAFCQSCPNKIIIHGFTENGMEPWIQAMTKELLRHGEYNVVTVNWKIGALFPYTQSVANARVTGAVVTSFIQQLQETFNISAESIHLIGHSLGAHVAGYVGNNIDGIGRITGLDPAKPFFENMPTDVRLDQSDANFVDVIHTDIGNSPLHLNGLGYHSPMGHVDFYPNGGQHQPGCQKNVIEIITKAKRKLTAEVMQYVQCNHVRSLALFTESINTPCPFLSVVCKDWTTYDNGDCFQCSDNNTTCVNMGFHATKPSTNESSSYFLLTGNTRRFCKYHYKVTIEVSEGQHGRLFVTLLGEHVDAKTVLLGWREMSYKSDSNHSFVIGEQDVGDIKSLAVHWEAVTKPFNPKTWYIWHKPMLQLRRVLVTSLESGQIVQFCFDDNVRLKSGKEVVKIAQKRCQ